MKKLLYLIIITGLIPTSSFSHSGGTDAYGCHHDRQRGGYHCHTPKKIELPKKKNEISFKGNNSKEVKTK